MHYLLLASWNIRIMLLEKSWKVSWDYLRNEVTGNSEYYLRLKSSENDEKLLWKS